VDVLPQRFGLELAASGEGPSIWPASPASSSARSVPGPGSMLWYQEPALFHRTLEFDAAKMPALPLTNITAR
jgi:hypothetical protein